VDSDFHRSGFLYLLVLLVGFLPWTFFVPLGLLHGKDRTSRPGERLCVWWFIGVLVGLSLFSPKHPSLLAFIWPPISLLIPAALYETRQKFSVWEALLGKGLARSLPYLLKLPLLLGGLLALVWFSELLEKVVDPAVAKALRESPEALPLFGLAAVGAVGTFLISFRVQKLVKAGETANATFESAGGAFFFLVFASFLLPLLGPVESARTLLVDHVKPVVGEARLCTYGERRPADVMYYLDRNVEHFEEPDPQASDSEPRQKLEAYLKSSERVYLLSSEIALKGLDIQFPSLRSRLHSTGVEGPAGTRHLVLLTNQPSAER